jgi:hypothetical protein
MKRRCRGAAAIELALVIIPSFVIFSGTVTLGLQLGQSVHVAAVTRDGASMFVRGVDFTQPSNQNLLVRLAQGLGMTTTGGAGEIMFTRVTYITAQMCGTTPGCHSNMHVITHRIVVGNAGLRASHIGSPTGMDSTGLIPNYMVNPTTVAAFPYMQLQAGEYAYVTESYFTTPQFALPGFTTPPSNYSIAIF